MKRLKLYVGLLIGLTLWTVFIGWAYEDKKHTHVEVFLMINSLKGVPALYCPEYDAVVTNNNNHKPRLSEVRIR